MQDLTRVQVLKLDEKHLQHIEDDVVVEEPLEVRVNGESFSVTMRTPGDDFDLAIGLLWTEGIIHSAGEIGTMAYCPNEEQPELKNIVNVGLVDANRKLESSRRLWSNSSCGLCGKATLDAIHQECRRIDSRITISYDVVIEDPKVFTRPWRIAMPIYRRVEPNMQLLEFRCNEFVEEFMYGNLRRQPLVKRWEGDTMTVEITRKVPPGDLFYQWYGR